MARIFVHAISCAAVIACSSAAFARDLAVPSRFPTIARAMRAAKAGDRVVVSGGTWKHVRVTKTSVALVGREGAVIVGTAKVTGIGAELSGFRIDGSVVATKRAMTAFVRGNTLLAKGDIVVAGDFAVVDGNGVAEGTIRVDGDGVVISGNTVACAFGAETSAIEVLGRRASVTGNDVSHAASAAGIVIRGDGATVSDNSLHAYSGGSAIVVDAGWTLVRANTIAESAASSSNGIELNGDGNFASDNTITGVGVDGVRVVSGDYNGLDANVITDAGRCGINVVAEATGTLVTDCTATGACMGIVNSGAASTVTGCTFLANRDHDVVVATPCLVFTGNQFSTSLGTLAEPDPEAPPAPPDVTAPIIFIGGDFGD